MKEKPIQINFNNQQNPKAEFDIIKLEELFLRMHLKHSPFDSHLVKFYILIIIEAGKNIHTIDFTQYECQEGTLLTIRKDQIHKFHKNSSVKGTALLFTDEFLVSYLEKLEALKSLQLFNELLCEPVLQLQESKFQEILDIVKQLEIEYFNINDSYSSGIIRSELHILITKLFRIKSQNNPTAYNRKYLNEFIKLQKLAEDKVTKTNKVADYAEMMNVSSKTLNNITKDIINKTAKEFIDDICIKQIKRLLINTKLSIKEIAYTSGFDEITNFFKYFKRQTKLTPEQFRTALI